MLREWITSLPGPPAAGPPTIVPAGGEFTEPVTVTIRYPDPEAVVRYTLDGRPPGENSAAYTHPLRLTGPTTVRARAYRPAHTRSVVVQETFVVGE